MRLEKAGLCGPFHHVAARLGGGHALVEPRMQQEPDCTCRVARLRNVDSEKAAAKGLARPSNQTLCTQLAVKATPSFGMLLFNECISQADQRLETSPLLESLLTGCMYVACCACQPFLQVKDRKGGL